MGICSSYEEYLALPVGVLQDGRLLMETSQAARRSGDAEPLNRDPSALIEDLKARQKELAGGE